MKHRLAAHIACLVCLGLLFPWALDAQNTNAPKLDSAAPHLSAVNASASETTSVHVAGRLINRRTYHVFPGRLLDALALAQDLQKVTKNEFGKDLKILTARYGPSFHTVVLELEYDSQQELDEFDDIWHPMLHEQKYVERWFQFVHGGTNELWRTH